MHKLMIVEDDVVIREEMKQALIQWGYDVVIATKFDAVLDTFITEAPQIVILDLTLPHFNGYYWCQEIRKISKVPILFLSSHQQPMDVVMAINFGADDYVTKPFDMGVLTAKIQGLLRRSYEFTAEQDWLDFAGTVLNLKNMTLSYHGETIDLSKNEFQILRVLYSNPDELVSRDRLMRELWNSDVFIDDNTLSVNVARLRKKLEGIGLGELIITRKGIGYGLVKGHE